MTKNPKISPVYFSAIADLVGWVDERKPNISTKQYSLPKLINIIHPTVTVFFEKFRAIAISSYYQVIIKVNFTLAFLIRSAWI
ncbi:hypothetical protein PN480_03825 [Dolichospermum circinale CS-1225]|uniref:hypothetical protein n=1 Tax=Dolichospermum circinale TaxID=109265 RepID=UPI0003FF5973|nr:hypothetical protein [Dolichospermum circinale]MDB9466964.1 hypothetical protein [Dolichospermum circinale CS-539/09]MDB9470003.1 hypothetical protein [Dolichospermum circinale CS-539]MDB9521083.1 hypothetical protein [Dolichospermum circinale CS-1225]MDB9546806.1 hypothetical protein [Dolichospermum circinale CS-1031]